MSASPPGYEVAGDARAAVVGAGFGELELGTMARSRSRRSAGTRRRSRRGRSRRRRRTRRSGGVNILLIAVILVVGVLALRNMDRDGGGSTGGGAATTTTTAPVPPNVRRTLNRLAALPVAAESSGAGYERAAFGDGWLVGRDGCDTRDEVLAAESREPATEGRNGCTVTRGDWLSLYDGYSTPDPDELDIDHMVPLAEAWESGASAWTPEERERYANDTDPHRPDALVAVTAATNRSKSDRDPAEWMPPDRDAWCRYATAWITQKRAWHLTIDPAERRALRNVLASC